MRRDEFTSIELWVVRSKPRAFAFLLVLALSISAGLTGTASFLLRVAEHGLWPLAIASTP
jgi:hypothetical protein